MSDDPKVVSMDRRRNQDTIEALRHLLAQAEAGQIRGFAYVVEYTERHAVGSTGNYRRKPSSAIGPALDLVDALRALPNA
jgi:hypothetical protein